MIKFKTFTTSDLKALESELNTWSETTRPKPSIKFTNLSVTHGVFQTSPFAGVVTTVYTMVVGYEAPDR